MTHEERLAAARAFRVNVLNERSALRTELAETMTDLAAVANTVSTLSAVWTLLPPALRGRLEKYLTP